MKIKVNNQTIDLGSKINGLYSSVESMGSAIVDRKKRDVLKIDFPFNETTYKALGWIDLMPWSIVIEESYWDEESHQTKVREVEFDKSEYCLVCDKVIHADTNNVTVYMGKYTNEELLESVIDDLLGE